jgi:hypothetical protein
MAPAVVQANTCHVGHYQDIGTEAEAQECQLMLSEPEAHGMFAQRDAERRQYVHVVEVAHTSVRYKLLLPLLLHRHFM